jgi:hypothetical protein
VGVAGPPIDNARPLLSLVKPSDSVKPLAERLLRNAWLVETLDGVPRGFAGVAVTQGGRVLIGATGELRQAAAGGEERVVTSFGLGLQGGGDEQGDYELLEGTDLAAPDRVVANDAFLAAAGARIGDTLDVAVGFDPQLRSYAGRRTLVVAGRGRFFYTAAGQAVAALPLATLQAMGGAERTDRVSLVMAKVRDGADVERVRRWIERERPSVTAISIETALRQVDERLSYFRQLAFILGAISLVVGFLLVTTLVTVSVNERVGEIAVMRAIGVSRAHVVQQVLVEGAAISAAGAADEDRGTR